MILKNHLPYRGFLAGHKFGRYEPERYTINFSVYNLVNHISFLKTLMSIYFKQLRSKRT